MWRMWPLVLCFLVPAAGLTASRGAETAALIAGFEQDLEALERPLQALETLRADGALDLAQREATWQLPPGRPVSELLQDARDADRKMEREADLYEEAEKQALQALQQVEAAATTQHPQKVHPAVPSARAAVPKQAELPPSLPQLVKTLKAGRQQAADPPPEVKQRAKQLQDLGAAALVVALSVTSIVLVLCVLGSQLERDKSVAQWRRGRRGEAASPESHGRRWCFCRTCSCCCGCFQRCCSCCCRWMLTCNQGSWMMALLLAMFSVLSLYTLWQRGILEPYMEQVSVYLFFVSVIFGVLMIILAEFTIWVKQKVEFVYGVVAFVDRKMDTVLNYAGLQEERRGGAGDAEEAFSPGSSPRQDGGPSWLFGLFDDGPKTPTITRPPRAPPPVGTAGSRGFFR